MEERAQDLARLLRVASEERHDVCCARLEIAPERRHVESRCGVRDPPERGRERRLAGLLGDQPRPDFVAGHRTIRRHGYEALDALLSFGPLALELHPPAVAGAHNLSRRSEPARTVEILQGSQRHRQGSDHEHGAPRVDLRIQTRESFSADVSLVTPFLKLATVSRGPDRVAKVVRNAERGCFVLQALQNPMPVTARTMLNGAPLGPGTVRGESGGETD